MKIDITATEVTLGALLEILALAEGNIRTHVLVEYGEENLSTANPITGELSKGAKLDLVAAKSVSLKIET